MCYDLHMKVILAVVDLYFKDIDYKIQEAKELCLANGLEVVSVVVQKAQMLSPNTAFRKGKLLELKEACVASDVKMVVFLNNLSLGTLSKIAQIIECKVIDRTTLILDIFASRAKSREAKLQIEVARLKYDLPKVLKESADSDRAQGGVNMRGVGEMRSTLIRNTMRQKIHALEKELALIKKENALRSKRRTESPIKKVALVGYTNAGKSSLMNALLTTGSHKEVFVKDMLFATLDTDVRKVSYKNYTFILYDTVGFVSDLPHELIEAFNSTLSAAKEADLLIDVIDYANEDHKMQKTITEEVLKTIGIKGIPIIDVYNKIDKTKVKDEYPLMISCKEKLNIDKLLDVIIANIYPEEMTLEGVIAYSDLGIIDELQNYCHIEKIKDTDKGTRFILKGPRAIISSVRKYLTV